jgi:hypothetical protein
MMWSDWASLIEDSQCLTLFSVPWPSNFPCWKCNMLSISLDRLELPCPQDAQRDMHSAEIPREHVSWLTSFCERLSLPL